MAGGLVGIHSMLGGLVVVALIVVAVMAGIQMARGEGQAARMVSLVASALLILQYIIGFVLIGSGFQNSNTHYVVGLLVLVPIALQHSSVKRLSPRTQGLAVLIWALAAAFLSIIAYMTGLAGTTVIT